MSRVAALHLLGERGQLLHVMVHVKLLVDFLENLKRLGGKLGFVFEQVCTELLHVYSMRHLR